MGINREGVRRETPLQQISREHTASCDERQSSELFYFPTEDLENLLILCCLLNFLYAITKQKNEERTIRI